MAKTKKFKTGDDSSRRNSRTTMSGPATPGGSQHSPDDLVAKTAGTHALSSRTSSNTNKPDEFAHAENAGRPSRGQHERPDDPLVGASTVTEGNSSEKVGSGGPPIGANKTIGPLDPVRVDSTDRALTTNQGVPVADNQNSLKAGLRGPTEEDEEEETPTPQRKTANKKTARRS